MHSNRRASEKLSGFDMQQRAREANTYAHFYCSYSQGPEQSQQQSQTTEKLVNTNLVK